MGMLILLFTIQWKPYIYRTKTYFKDQYKLLYLALKDAFYGQNKCLKSEKFLGEYQEQTCYTNCGDVSQKKSLSSELEVNLYYDLY